jgi:hypothetical protein
MRLIAENIKIYKSQNDYSIGIDGKQRYIIKTNNNDVIGYREDWFKLATKKVEIQFHRSLILRKDNKLLIVRNRIMVDLNTKCMYMYSDNEEYGELMTNFSNRTKITFENK